MTGVSDTALLEMHRQMSMARKIDQGLASLPGFHPAAGEEGVMVGAFHGLRREDYIAPHYRGALAVAHMRGADLRMLIAGMLGKVTGHNAGRFRGDVCMPIELRIIGMFNGILGGTLGLATGAALSAKTTGKSYVAVATFGEGSSNLGAFHESINFGATLGLPIVYVCQNNQYAMSTRATQSMRGASVADRGAGYGIPGVKVDGNDVVAVHAAVQEAVDRARSGEGPTLIEALTYRVSGHYGGEKPVYQDPAERDSWIRRDPLRLLEQRLLDAGLLDTEQLEKIHLANEAAMIQARALAQSDPDPESLNPEDVYADSDSGVLAS